MNRDLLKENYLKNVDAEKQKKYCKGYEAHHIAELSDEFIDHDENCIMLKENEADLADLIENQDYRNWLNQKLNHQDLSKMNDMKEIKEILKPIKKILKEWSPEKEKRKIITKILEGK